MFVYARSMFGNLNIVVTVVVLVVVVALISWGVQALVARRRRSLDSHVNE